MSGNGAWHKEPGTKKKRKRKKLVGIDRHKIKKYGKKVDDSLDRFFGGH